VPDDVGKLTREIPLGGPVESNRVEPPLRDVLAGAARSCPGVAEVLLVDSQGMLIESYAAGGGTDPEELAVETMAAVPALGRVAASARVGRPSEWLMVGDRGTLVVRRVGPLELFVVLRVPGDEYVGRVRLAARIVAGRLLDTLS
jgi:predicted regulator of Ras-like GTPase activity (Roadblock/LC7/MglB family)